MNIERYVQAYVEHRVAGMSQNLQETAEPRLLENIHRKVATDVLTVVYDLIEADARNDLAWGIVDELQDIKAPHHVTEHIRQKYYDEKADLARFDRTTPGFWASHIENPVTGDVTEAERG